METKETQVKTNHTAGAEEAPKKGNNKRFIIVLIVLVLAGGTFGISKYIHGQHHEETDDAQIEANISPVIPRIGGYITEVRVKDNQRVKKGDTLLLLDNRDELIKVEEAKAALAGAQSGLTVSESAAAAAKEGISSQQTNVAIADAQIEAAKVTLWRANQDFDRYANLIKDHSITQQQYEQAEATKQSAERQLKILQAQRTAASTQTSTVSSQSRTTYNQVSVQKATIMQREADLENAKLALSYTAVIAATDGILNKTNVQVGQFVQAGQALFNLVLDEAPWVVANFKETQLTKMKIGQKVLVTVDAFPDHEFEAKLTSFSPATGARFALLPPDNASGNFVKVVQRLPVKIEFVDAKDERIQSLRPGMNVAVDVHLD